MAGKYAGMAAIARRQALTPQPCTQSRKRTGCREKLFITKHLQQYAFPSKAVPFKILQKASSTWDQVLKAQDYWGHFSFGSFSPQKEPENTIITTGANKSQQTDT